MTKPYGPKVTDCPSCNKPIGAEHPYTWCAECGTPLPVDVLALIPKQIQAQKAMLQDAKPKVEDSHPKTFETVSDVKIVDFNMPFGSMVYFMIKWALASIPAIIILFIIGAIVGAVFNGLLISIFKR